MALAGPGTAELPQVMFQQGDDLRSADDSGVSATIAGLSCLKSLDQRLQEHGLRPIRAATHQVFCGLGGAKCVAEASWTATGGSHTTQECFAIDGDMAGLTSREDLERCGTNLCMHDGTTKADSEEPNACGVRQDPSTARNSSSTSRDRDQRITDALH